MANFKNNKPRVSRSGCKLCKPWKIGGNADEHKKHVHIAAELSAKEAIKEAQSA